MLLSEMCRKKNEALWERTLDHPMLKEMAEGTLPVEKFRYYMIQDYFYLLRYIDIFSAMLVKAEELEEKEFVSDNIAEVIAEIRRVHMPNMKKAGISDGELQDAQAHIDVLSYTNYMRETAEKGDYLAGLVAILNCSWSYAYLAGQWAKRHPEKIEKSPYREWFSAYAAGDYVKTNTALCRKVDALSKSCSEAEKSYLADVFHNCALYEYRLWDMFYLCGDNVVRKEITCGIY